MEIILASSSPRRQELLREAGFYFRSEAPQIDEWNPVTHPDLTPVTLAQANARRKAEEIAVNHQSAIVLAADTIVCCQGKILGKPKDRVDATAMLGWLNGKTHEVITAMSWLDTGRKQIKEYVARTQVTFRSLSAEDIEHYLDKVHVYDKAGAYALQEHGQDIVERIEGSRTNVIGLPMEIVREWWNSIEM